MHTAAPWPRRASGRWWKWLAVGAWAVHLVRRSAKWDSREGLHRWDHRGSGGEELQQAAKRMSVAIVEQPSSYLQLMGVGLR